MAVLPAGLDKGRIVTPSSLFGSTELAEVAAVAARSQRWERGAPGQEGTALTCQAGQAQGTTRGDKEQPVVLVPSSGQ